MIWVAMFGASLALRKGIHVSVNSIKSILPERSWEILLFLINLIGSLFMVLLIYIGIRVILAIKVTGQVSPSMEFFPMYLLYISVPIGSFLMLIQFLKQGFTNQKEYSNFKN